MKKETWISFVAIVIAIAALSTSIVRVEPLAWDMASVLVAVLGVLVTVAIGWQIFNIIEWRKEKTSTMEKILKLHNNIITNGYVNSASFYLDAGDIHKVSGNYEAFLLSYFNALLYQLKTDQLSTANACVQVILESFPNGLSIREFTKKQMLDLFYGQMDGVNRLDKYKELEDLIVHAEVTDKSNRSQLSFS